MKNEYTAVVKQEDDWWVGWIAEIPGVNCQEKTLAELKETLQITLREALEFNRQDPKRKKQAEDPLEKFIGKFKLNKPDWADNHDAYIAEMLNENMKTE